MPIPPHPLARGPSERGRIYLGQPDRSSCRERGGCLTWLKSTSEPDRSPHSTTSRPDPGTAANSFLIRMVCAISETRVL